MAEIETVKIQAPNAPDEFVVINKEDFDPQQHKLFEAPKAKSNK